jgi:hypothetical protein
MSPDQLEALLFSDQQGPSLGPSAVELERGGMDGGTLKELLFGPTQAAPLEPQPTPEERGAEVDRQIEDASKSIPTRTVTSFFEQFPDAPAAKSYRRTLRVIEAGNPRGTAAAEKAIARARSAQIDAINEGRRLIAERDMGGVFRAEGAERDASEQFVQGFKEAVAPIVPDVAIGAQFRQSVEDMEPSEGAAGLAGQVVGAGASFFPAVFAPAAIAPAFAWSFVASAAGSEGQQGIDEARAEFESRGLNPDEQTEVVLSGIARGAIGAIIESAGDITQLRVLSGIARPQLAKLGKAISRGRAGEVVELAQPILRSAGIEAGEETLTLAGQLSSDVALGLKEPEEAQRIFAEQAPRAALVGAGAGGLIGGAGLVAARVRPRALPDEAKRGAGDVDFTETPPRPSTVTRDQIKTNRGLAAWASQNPEAAAAISVEETPTKRQVRNAGIRGRWSDPERTQLSRRLRQLAETETDIRTDVSKVADSATRPPEVVADEVAEPASELRDEGDFRTPTSKVADSATRRPESGTVESRDPSRPQDGYIDNRTPIKENVKTGGKRDGKLPKSVSELMLRLESIVGQPLREGRFSQLGGRLKGIMKLDSFVARYGKLDPVDHKLGTAAHEVAHAIDGMTRLEGWRDAGNAPVEPPHALFHEAKAHSPYADAPKEVLAELRDLDYSQHPKNGRRSYEGWAEYIRLRMTKADEVAGFAPRVDAWFHGEFAIKRPDLYAKIEKAAAIIDAWRLAQPSDRAAANLRMSGDAPKLTAETMQEYMALPGKKARAAWHSAYRSVAKDTDVAKQMDKDKARLGYEVDRPLEKAAEATRNADVSLTAAAVDGNGIYNPETRQHRAPSLRIRLQQAGVVRGVLQSGDFDSYLYARRAIELLNRDKPVDVGLTKQTAEATVADIEQRYGEAYMRKLANAYTEWNNDLLKLMHEVGMMTDKELADLIKSGENYAPLYVAGKYKSNRGGKGGIFSTGLVRIKGGPRDRIAPMSAAPLKAERVFRAVIDFQLTRTIVKEMGRPGLGHWVERRVAIEKEGIKVTDESVREALKRAGVTDTQMDELPPELGFTMYRNLIPGSSDNIYFIRENGEWEAVRVNDDIRGLMESLKTHGYVPLFSELHRLFKAGAVGINGTFAMAQAVMDPQTNLLFTNRMPSLKKIREQPNVLLTDPAKWLGMLFVAGARAGHGLARDSVGLTTKDAKLEFLFNAQGRMNVELRLDGKSVRRTRRQIARLAEDNEFKKAIGSLNPLEPFTAIQTVMNVLSVPAETIDMAPRFSDAMKAMDDYGITAEKLREGVALDPAGVEAVIWAAREATTNFQGAGRLKVIKQLNSIIPFLRAAINSVDRAGRLARNDPMRAALAATIVSMMAAAYWLYKHDEDDYEEEPEWLRNGWMTFRVGEQIVRIPVGRDPIILGSYAFTKHALDQAYNEHPRETLAVVRAWAERAALPPWSNPIADTVMVWAGNYDRFRGRPVEPRVIRGTPREELDPDLRYTERTSAAARELGALTGLSPIKLEQTAINFSGGFINRNGLVAKTIGGAEDTSILDLAPARALTLRKDPSETLDRYYKEMVRVTRKINRIKELGQDEVNEPYQDLVYEERRIDWAKDLLDHINETIWIDGIGSERAAHAHRTRIAVARWALGEEDLNLYPNPLRKSTGHKAVDGFTRDELGKLATRTLAGADLNEQTEKMRVLIDAIGSTDVKDAMKHLAHDMNNRKKRLSSASRGRRYRKFQFLHKRAMSIIEANEVSDR